MLKMDKIKKIKESKIYKVAMIIIKTLFFILLIVFLFVVCLQLFTDNKMSVFDYRMFTVISGSMRPKYDIGDVLVAKEVEPSTIKVGDTISYLGSKGSFKNKVITHEVIGVKKNDNGKYIFKAQGLANLVEDPDVYEEQLYGVVVYKSLLLSMIYRIVATKIGFYIFIILPLMFVIGSEFLSVLLEKEEKRRSKLKKNS